MQPFYKRFSVVTGFTALLVLLLINGIIIRRQVAVQVQNQQWVRHTQDVLLQISRTESLLKDAEIGQRGYLYTGVVRYLTPYDDTFRQIGGEIDKLAGLTADNPLQQDRIAKLRTLANQKLKELADTITLYRAGRLEDARALVLTNAGLLTMDKIRGLLSEMRNDEQRLEAERIREYRHSVRVTVFCIYAASILAALGLIALAYFI